jgi:two-component system, sensor histidine kinase YesM
MDNLQKYNPVYYFLKFFKNLKFKKKLFFSYIVISIIPITILGIYSFEQAKNFLLIEAEQGLNESISQIAETLNSKFKRYNDIVYFVTYNQQVTQIINNEDSSYFQKYVDYTEVLDPLFISITSINNEIDSMVIYTSNSNITERSNSIQSIDRIKSNSWFNSVMSDQLVHWMIDNQSLIGLTRFHQPFKNASLNILYTKMRYNLVFDIDMNNVREYGIFITDNNSNMIFSKSNIDDSKYNSNDKLLSESQEGIIKINGIQYILIKRKIDETGWLLSYLCPVNAIAINAGKIVEAMIIIIVACLIILLFITWVFSNTLVKRIYNLNYKMRLAEEGNLNLDVSSGSKDEIGELTNRFGKMLKNISILIDEVYQGKILQKEAEMKALQAQINPHFLYNTLSLINWKAIQIGDMEISLITRNISKFYRTILNKGRDVISIEDEIANIKCYVDIQLALHNYSFSVEYDFEDEIYEYDMIKIILQPIVENALEHGIDLLTERNGKLVISGLVKDKSILFIIEDNGPGMDEEILDNIFSIDTGGYGLKNIQDRLKVFFGAEFGIKISSIIGKGTSVTIKIPQYKIVF